MNSFLPGVLGWDANETFTATPGGEYFLSHTGRGEMALQWMAQLDLKLPPQNLAKPTFHPYNREIRARRLDYICLRGMAATSGDVLELKDLASSNREPVQTQLEATAPKAKAHSEGMGDSPTPHPRRH